MGAKFKVAWFWEYCNKYFCLKIYVKLRNPWVC